VVLKQVLDTRTHHLNAILQRCIDRYGRHRVLFDIPYIMTRDDAKQIEKAAKNKPVSTKDN
jgi:hypothetical protein